MKARKFVFWTGTVVLGLLVSQTAIAREGIPVEKIPGRSVSVSHAYADVQGENLMVAGKVSRWHELQLAGHVDVAVYDPDGNLLALDKARLPGLMSQRKGRLDLPFSCRFDFVPPQGSIIRVRYHGLPAFVTEEDNENGFSCSHNVGSESRAV